MSGSNSTEWVLGKSFGRTIDHLEGNCCVFDGTTANWPKTYHGILTGWDPVLSPWNGVLVRGNFLDWNVPWLCLSNEEQGEGPADCLEIPGGNPEDPIGDPKQTNESLEAAGGRSRSIGEGQGMEAQSLGSTKRILGRGKGILVE